jgi:RNA polymerase sigma-70 factor, ECF subfamily
MADDEQQLCSRAQGGDIEAASELVALFQEKVFCYFRRLCGNNEDAEDLTQKTFFKVWTSLAGYQTRSTASTWIHAIAHHVYVDWRRKNNPMESQPEAWWDNCVADGPSPFENARERDLARQVYALVETLEPDGKEVVHLHYYQGFSIKDTAEILDVATSTVKYRLREALHILRSRAVEPTGQF